VQTLISLILCFFFFWWTTFVEEGSSPSPAGLAAAGVHRDAERFWLSYEAFAATTISCPIGYLVPGALSLARG